MTGSDQAHNVLWKVPCQWSAYGGGITHIGTTYWAETYPDAMTMSCGGIGLTDEHMGLILWNCTLVFPKTVCHTFIDPGH